MSDDLFNAFDAEEDDPNGGQSPPPSALRQFAESTQRENKELKERIASLEAASRKAELAKALSGAGKDPAAVSLIPADVTDADGVTTWLEANGALIKDAEAAGTEGQEQLTPENQQNLTEEEAEALAAVSGAPEGVVPPSVSSPELTSLGQAESREDFYARLSKAQLTP